MEGLIPLVYRTLKKTKTRRRYECLSSGAAQPYNITDFYVQSPTQTRSHFYVESNNTSVAEKNIYGRGHRRRMSTGDISSSVNGMKITGDSTTPAGPKLTRFGSHKMFSCVTGC
ncbi:hypothetical protein V6N11_033039 [Hibiscus sabdariffa]|uniref:Uncharacterized protein n=2 Tax=Hibiscus sabdariffa TaxID=183260 RepID=A0ABR1ZE41_9ROSI